MKHICIALFFFTSICSAQPATQPASKNTVVWISIDGFRGDYLKRFNPPALSKLAAEGAFTSQERPIFPSLTFPNHIAQVTGTTVDGHGIPMNDFFDTSTQQIYHFPDNGSLIRAEPIWITAKRQGLRVAVIDWPMSHAQSGEYKSDFSEQQFDKSETDAKRLTHVADVLNADHTNPPLRLVMTYVSHVNTIGHRYGPDSPQLQQAVMDVDASIDPFVKSVVKWFDATHAPDDELYVLLTTDHGMQTVNTEVNLDRLIGADLFAGVHIVTSGPVANIYLGDLPADQQANRADQIVAKLKTNVFLRAWRSNEMPPELHYSDPSRIGQVVALLKPGYTWTSRRTATTMPVAVKGMHGYDPAEAPNMFGFSIAWRYRHPLTNHDIGPIDNTQWHATVAKLLGIDPSAKSDHRPIDLH